jgi:hypothetical protein
MRLESVDAQPVISTALTNVAPHTQRAVTAFLHHAWDAHGEKR